ncbi:MAG: hypothetical protein AB8B61_00060 [Cyclobacteriaceae bacterium]
MINSLPFYIPAVFIFTSFLTVFLFLRAVHFSKIVIFVCLGILLINGSLAYSGFYLNTTSMPPRFILVIIPTVIIIVFTLNSKWGNAFIQQVDLPRLTLVHVIRIPVEIVLYWLFLEKAVPELMTFAGRNFDILAGLTAPFIYYFSFIAKNKSKKLLLVWNIVGTGLLINIIVHAILSAPLPLQQLAFDQPNIALMYFPFVWLPAIVAPIPLFSHVITIKRLITEK